MISPPVIAPIKYLKDFCTSKTQICYSTITMQSETYKNFYIEESKLGKTVILDFSPGLIRNCSNLSLFRESILTIQPAVVVLPDFDFFNKRSLNLSLSFLHEISSYPFLKGVIGVVQGKNLEELDFSYRSLKDKVTAIALPASLEKIESRNFLLKELNISTPSIYIEVFKSLVEESPPMKSSVKVMWSSLPFRLAYIGKTLEYSYTTPPPLDFHTRESLPFFTNLNIEKYREVLGKKNV